MGSEPLKRYELVAEMGHLLGGESPTGEWVKHSDAQARIADLERAVASLRRKLKATRHNAETVPAGYIQVEAWMNDAEIVVMGDPPSEEQDPDCKIHHCDSMGCGSFGPHVIARIPNPSANAALEAARRTK